MQHPISIDLWLDFTGNSDHDHINKKKQQLRWSHREEAEINYSEGFSKQILTGTFSKYKIQSEIIQLNASEISIVCCQCAQCDLWNVGDSFQSLYRLIQMSRWYSLAFVAELITETVAALLTINCILQSTVNILKVLPLKC